MIIVQLVKYNNSGLRKCPVGEEMIFHEHIRRVSWRI